MANHYFKTGAPQWPTTDSHLSTSLVLSLTHLLQNFFPLTPPELQYTVEQQTNYHAIKSAKRLCELQRAQLEKKWQGPNTSSVYKVNLHRGLQGANLRNPFL